MQYMVPKNGKRATHFWDGGDTYCTMFSTGGIRKIDRYWITDDLSKGAHNRFCAMCLNRHEAAITQRMDLDALKEIRKFV